MLSDVKPSALLCLPLLVAATAAQQQSVGGGAATGAVERRAVSMSAWRERLHGMWLGEAIANWTGLRSEGLFDAPPFLTDADWGTDVGAGKLKFIVNQDPWRADDDTDIEYVYAHLLDLHQSALLSPAEITAGWIDHINHHIWVSNAAARALMSEGVQPPATGMGMVNELGIMIDAQLTTELFGALAPGMPEVALELADLPIRTSAYGYAEHAAQVFVVMYSLAVHLDPAAPLAPQLVALVSEARGYLPNSSKSADILDFVLAEYLASTDVDDWELTRDRIHDRYQANAAANGYVYRFWWESSVNLATTVMALLFGEGDFKRTVQIATLSGWDSDNSAATSAGLLGLIHGRAGIAAAFPGATLSDRYTIKDRRDNLPDYLPNDPEAEDTFTRLVDSMLPMVSRAVLHAGGRVDVARDEWVLPARPTRPALDANPAWRRHAASAGQRVRDEGGFVSAFSSIPGHASGSGTPGDPARFADGFESDGRGLEPPLVLPDGTYSSAGATQPASVTLTVLYDRLVLASAVRFSEGPHASDGGWFTSLSVQLRVAGQWISPPGGTTASDDLDQARPHQVIDFGLTTPLLADGVRLVGVPGGSARYVTALELDVLEPLD
jgi:hypothetical protein